MTADPTRVILRLKMILTFKNTLSPLPALSLVVAAFRGSTPIYSNRPPAFTNRTKTNGFVELHIY